MNQKAVRRCVIYARISVTSEESVSIERQVEAAEQYAAARGWTVIETFKDDGVSATHNKPEERAGWKALLASPLDYDAVVIWKVDRLARRLLDFLHADEDLQARGAGLVCVEDPIDMSTAQGRAFAQMLGVFGELEAATIRARVTAARNHLLRAGRSVGGAIPFGWRNIPNPDGPGFVVAHDPEKIDWVRRMADRTLGGQTLYSTAQWLDAEGAPLSTARAQAWSYRTVERLLRNPILAGMTRYNPGTSNKVKVEGDGDVLRGDDGLPVVDESVAIMSVADWRRMIDKLDNRDRSRPAAMNRKTSGAFSGLMWCGDKRHTEPVRMWRTTATGRPGYACPDCHQTISNFEDILVRHFLDKKGDHVRWTVVEEVREGGAALLPEIERRLDELDRLIRDAGSPAERKRLQGEQSNLLDLRDEKRLEAPTVSLRYEPANQFVTAWENAGDDIERRAVLGDAMERIVVKRVGPGRRTEAGVLKRLDIAWKGPVGEDPEMAE